jgi:hypothetical protein
MEIDELTEQILVDEAKKHSSTIISRQTKVKKAAGQLASTEARKRNDPLYQRMTKYRELYYKYRAMIHKKYGPRVKSRARR